MFVWLKAPRHFLFALMLSYGIWLLSAWPNVSMATTASWTNEEPLDAKERPARLRLLSGGLEGDKTSPILLGIEFELLPGWKIYWRTPGDAGFPPELDWSGSRNLKSLMLLWPAPERFRVLGMDTLGYHDRVVFPIRARIEHTEQHVELRATVTYLVCDKVCIPGETKLALDLTEDDLISDATSPARETIERALARVPGKSALGALTIERAEYAEASGLLSVVARTKIPFSAPDLYIEDKKGTFFGAPKIRFWAAKRRAIFHITVKGPGGVLPKEAVLLGQDLRFTLVDGVKGAKLRAIDRTLTVEPASILTLGPETLTAILMLAVLGGFILNLMPCVLPVLSLKLLSIASHGGAPKVVVRKGFLASVAGILFAFLLLATTIAALREAGHAVGWGFQFQMPFFLLLMIIVLTLFAANLWGFFEIRLPSGLTSRLTGKHDNKRMAGHFMTGIFATALATPCSAPFLGTSIGFALSRGPLEIYMIFIALGLGLALPYLLVASFPGLVSYLPKPGRWITILRRVLGLALLATVLWLLLIFAVEMGERTSLAVAILMAGLLLAIGLRKRFPEARALLSSLVAALLMLPFAVTFMAPLPSNHVLMQGSASKDVLWRPFDASMIPILVSSGKLVFVDVTAKWCITCQANKTLVLDQERVLERLSDANVIAMRADWTRPNEQIADYLAQFGRFGIPFDVVYGPAAPTGIALPELLTQKSVLKAMKEAEDTK